MRCVALEHCRANQRSQATVQANPQCIQTRAAEVFFLGAAVLNAVVIGVDLELSLQLPEHSALGSAIWIVLLGLEAALTLVFLAEFVLRARASGRLYVCRPSGLLDAFLAVLSVVSICLELVSTTIASAVRAWRSLRLLKIVRLFVVIPELKLVCLGLMTSGAAMKSTLALIMLVAYVGALICTSLLWASDACMPAENGGACVQDEFGSVPISFLTHVKLVLVEAWPDIAAPMLVDSALWSIYIAAFIAVTSIGLLSTVSGYVCEQVMELAGKQPPRSWEEQQKQSDGLRARLGNLFDQARRGSDGNLSKEGCLRLLGSGQARDLLRDMHAALPPQSEQVDVLLDLEGCGRIAREDFVEGVLRLAGARCERGSRLLQVGLAQSCSQAIIGAEDAEHAVKALMKDSITRVGWQLLYELQDLSLQFDRNCLHDICEDVGSETSLQPLQATPTIIRPAMCTTVLSPCCTSPCSDETAAIQTPAPSRPASEAGLPPVNATPVVLRAGMYVAGPRTASGEEVEDACVELEALVKGLRSTAERQAWPQLAWAMPSRTDMATQTEEPWAVATDGEPEGELAKDPSAGGEARGCPLAEASLAGGRLRGLPEAGEETPREALGEAIGEVPLEPVQAGAASSRAVGEEEVCQPLCEPCGTGSEAAEATNKPPEETCEPVEEAQQELAREPAHAAGEAASVPVEDASAPFDVASGPPCQAPVHLGAIPPEVNEAASRAAEACTSSLSNVGQAGCQAPADADAPLPKLGEAACKPHVEASTLVTEAAEPELRAPTDAGTPLPAAGEADCQAGKDVAMPLPPARQVDRQAPTGVGEPPPEAGEAGCQAGADTSTRLPSASEDVLHGTTDASTPLLAASSGTSAPTQPRGWAAEPQAARRREELLARISRRAALEVLSTGTPAGREVQPAEPALERNQSHRDAFHSRLAKGQLHGEDLARLASTGQHDPHPLGTSRRLRVLGGSGVSPLHPKRGRVAAGA